MNTPESPHNAFKGVPALEHIVPVFWGDKEDATVEMMVNLFDPERCVRSLRIQTGNLLAVDLVFRTAEGNPIPTSMWEDFRARYFARPARGRQDRGPAWDQAGWGVHPLWTRSLWIGHAFDAHGLAVNRTPERQAVTSPLICRVGGEQGVRYNVALGSEVAGPELVTPMVNRILFVHRTRSLVAIHHAAAVARLQSKTAEHLWPNLPDVPVEH